MGEFVGALAETTGLTKAKAKEILDAHAELVIRELQTKATSTLPESIN